MTDSLGHLMGLLYVTAWSCWPKYQENTYWCHQCQKRVTLPVMVG